MPEPAVSPRQWHHGHLLMKIGLCPAAIAAVLGLGWAIDASGERAIDSAILQCVKYEFEN